MTGGNRTTQTPDQISKPMLPSAEAEGPGYQIRPAHVTITFGIPPRTPNATLLKGKPTNKSVCPRNKWTI